LWFHPLKAVTCRFRGVPPNKTGRAADTLLCTVYIVVAWSPWLSSVACTLSASLIMFTHVDCNMEEGDCHCIVEPLFLPL
ncbi:hypothetical protein BAE44_0000106, partial [Dichanthelium oligosanthes]